MARPRDPQRTADLLSAAADIVLRQGIAATTLRPLAAELGVSPRTLLYQFGSKDNLLAEVIRNLRHRQSYIARVLGSGSGRDTDPAERILGAIEQLWREAKRQEARPFLALYFELTTLAIREPEEHRPLLVAVDDEWTEAISAYLISSGVAVAEARALVDSLLIGYRGALCFALATERWGAADDSIATLMEVTRNRLSAAAPPVRSGRGTLRGNYP